MWGLVLLFEKHSKVCVCLTLVSISTLLGHIPRSFFGSLRTILVQEDGGCLLCPNESGSKVEKPYYLNPLSRRVDRLLAFAWKGSGAYHHRPHPGPLVSHFYRKDYIGPFTYDFFKI